MKRRSFGKSVVLGTGGLLAGSVSGHYLTQNSPLPEPVFPPPLAPGDRIGLIAPASSFDTDRYQRAVRNIGALGFRLLEGKHLHKKKGYLAGPDEGRLYDLHDMFRNPKVKGIWCLRGGYGSSRLLEKIDFDLIGANPKVFAGFSDITALLNAFRVKTGLVCFHSPVAASELTEYNRRHFLTLLRGEVSFPFEINMAADNLQRAEEKSEYRPFTIHPGKASGRLTGGNLSLLTALCGTPFLDSFRDKIVFIEDVGEPPYKIDRMLTQLLQATDIKNAAGIAFGICRGCEKREGSNSLRLEETLRDRIAGLGIPAHYGLPFGHIENQFTLPLGIKAELDADAGKLRLLESAVREN